MNRRKFLLSTGATLLVGSHPAFGTDAGPVRPAMPRRAVIPAALTPLNENLQIDLAEFRRQIGALAAVPGVSAIMVNGAAGHDSTLSRDERRRLLGAALATADGRQPILAALRERNDEPALAPFARDAEAEGAHALVIMPPAARAALTWAGARPRFEAVFAASRLPVAIYQTNYDTETLTRLAALPPVFAIKEGSGSPATFERNLRAVRSLERDVAVWTTHSSWLLADLATGADGLLSGMGSVVAELHVALAEAVWRSDLATARKVSERLFPLTQVFYRPGQDAHTRMLYALKRLGRLKCDAVRPPRKPLDGAERTAIDGALRASGLLH